MGEENKRAPPAAIMAIKKPTAGYSWENNPVSRKKQRRASHLLQKSPGEILSHFGEKIEATLSREYRQGRLELDACTTINQWFSLDRFRWSNFN